MEELYLSAGTLMRLFALVLLGVVVVYLLVRAASTAYWRSRADYESGKFKATKENRDGR